MKTIKNYLKSIPGMFEMPVSINGFVMLISGILVAFFLACVVLAAIILFVMWMVSFLPFLSSGVAWIIIIFVTFGISSYINYRRYMRFS